MDPITEAAVSAVVEGGLSSYTVTLLQALDDSYQELQQQVQQSGTAGEALTGLVGGLVVARLMLRQLIDRMTTP